MKPEPKIYLWLALGAIALVILMFFPFNPLSLPANMLVCAVALILALISLKMRRKVLPILAILASVIPLCCIGGGSLFLGGVDFLLKDRTASAPKPKVEWDPSPTAVIAQAARPIRSYQPSLSPNYTRSYIPDARLWGDGRIVWASYGDSGASRTVWEGQLTTEQMTALLGQFVDAGFFGWKDRYATLLPYDNPTSDYLTANLSSVHKMVTVTMGNPPADFNTLFYTLSSGAGAQGKIYTPTQGTLIAIPTTTKATQHNWDTENLNLDLSQAAEGISIEGKALQLAWEVVNINPYDPPVVSLNGVTYTIYVIIPGLMY